MFHITIEVICRNFIFFGEKTFQEVFINALIMNYYYSMNFRLWKCYKSLNYGCVALPWHFECYILKCKTFLINFLDELGNFKQKKFYTSKCKFFYILKTKTLDLHEPTTNHNS